MNKKHLSSKLCLLGIALCFTVSTQAQNKQDAQRIKQSYNLIKLRKIQNQFQETALKQKKQALSIAKQKGWEEKIISNGKVLELQKVENGLPIYYTTFNLNAAKSTRTNHLHSGGTLGLNLMGQNMTAHVWDGGIARASHQEYDGSGGENRFSVGDGSSSLNFHAAHVTGTIISSGVQAEAKGMAPYAKAVGYDWNNDKSEVVNAAANGMLVSNHSYGYAFRGLFGIVQLPQHYFGGYIEESRDWDDILFNAPNYLMIVAAGNDGNDNTANNNPTGGYGFDKLTGNCTVKNNLVVANAEDATIDTNGHLISVSINNSSSQGPTDDYRIKPDITGNGTSVYSTYDNSNTAYNSISGTSMAAPNVAGSLLILQQHVKNVSGDYMKAATLKGLALHTADDAGANGPDAVFGWGLLNTKRAAQVISNIGNKSKIEELTLNSGQTYTFTVESDGINPLLASISWTDRPGVANTTVNSTTPVLVNDLDIRVTKGSDSYYPYKLTGALTNAKQDNNVDPYERVDINNASGTYTITVTHKGSLVEGSQNFSLIVTGITSIPVICEATTPTNVSTSNISTNTATINWDAVTGLTYEVRHRQIGSSEWLSNSVNDNTIILNSLTEETLYEVQVRSTCEDGSVSNFSASTNFETDSITGIDVCETPTGISVSDITTNEATISWTETAEALTYELRYRQIGTSEWLSNSANSNSIVLTGLIEETLYEVQVRSTCENNSTSNFSASTNFETDSIPVVDITYCDSKGRNSSYEWIDYVEFGGMTNTTANDGGYKDYTNNIATVAKGSTNTLIISAGFRSSSYREYWKIWIDYNQDGVFENNETIASGSSSSSNKLSVDVQIPSSALTGKTRMRVSMKYNSAQTSCETFQYGEVEDYTVAITGDNFSSNTTYNSVNTTYDSLENIEDLNFNRISPNPAIDTVTLLIDGIRNASYEIFNIRGEQAMSGKTDGNNINISSLKSGLYLLKTYDGQKSFIIKFIKK